LKYNKFQYILSLKLKVFIAFKDLPIYSPAQRWLPVNLQRWRKQKQINFPAAFQFGWTNVNSSAKVAKKCKMQILHAERRIRRQDNADECLPGKKARTENW